MRRWELFKMSCELGLGGNATDIGSKKDKKTGKTKWDELMELASDGWKLIDGTSINSGGTTSETLFIFRRPGE